MTKVITRAKAREVDAFARARNGLYYGYGEAFTQDPRKSTDCSGLVLQTGAILMGRTDWVGNRYGSTESFRLHHATVYNIGFKPLPAGGVKALGFTPVMLVGLQHGGGGIYSHTACTLMFLDRPGGEIKVSSRGVDWESMGDGVRYYDYARAWNDPLFHDFWYLDARLESATAPAPTPPKEDLTVSQYTDIMKKLNDIEDQLGPKRAEWGPGSSFGKDSQGRELTMRDGLIAKLDRMSKDIASLRVEVEELK